MSEELEARVATLEKRVDRKSGEFESLHEAIHGNGKPGLRNELASLREQVTHVVNAVDGIKKAQDDDRQEWRVRMRIIFCGVAISIFAFIASLTFDGFRSRITRQDQHVNVGGTLPNAANYADLTTTQAAAKFGVSPETIRNWIASGQLPAEKIDGYWWIPSHAQRAKSGTWSNAE